MRSRGLSPTGLVVGPLIASILFSFAASLVVTGGLEEVVSLIVISVPSSYLFAFLGAFTISRVIGEVPLSMSTMSLASSMAGAAFLPLIAIALIGLVAQSIVVTPTLFGVAVLLGLGGSLGLFIALWTLWLSRIT